jgi:histidyl-tRNA synthetase
VQQRATDTSVYLVSFDDAALRENLVLADAVRRAGITAFLSYDKQSMKAQMRHANAAGARWVIIRGEDERAQNAVKLKDMQTGEETLVPSAEVMARLTKK